MVETPAEKIRKNRRQTPELVKRLLNNYKIHSVIEAVHGQKEGFRKLYDPVIVCTPHPSTESFIEGGLGVLIEEHAELIEDNAEVDLSEIRAVGYHTFTGMEAEVRRRMTDPDPQKRLQENPLRAPNCFYTVLLQFYTWNEEQRKET